MVCDNFLCVQHCDGVLLFRVLHPHTKKKKNNLILFFSFFSDDDKQEFSFYFLCQYGDFFQAGDEN